MEQRNQATAVEMLLVGAVFEQIGKKIRIPIGPLLAVGRTTEPAFLLYEVKKDNSSQQTLRKIPEWLFGCSAFFAVSYFADIEDRLSIF